jgi:outer membrane receptor protein involved in Fe transport
MITKPIPLLCLLLCIATAASAQTDLKGKVVDENNKPVEFATIMILNAADSVMVKGAISNAAGTYVFPQIKEGRYLLTASMMGYAKAWAGPVTVASGGAPGMPQLQLKENVEQLNAVTVVGQKPMIEQQADRTVVNVEGSILASGGNALEVLERAPGVIVDKDDNINLNGKNGVIVMIDGRRTRMSGAEVANLLRNMPSDAVQRVDIITNPSAKYDADGNSGIIDIRTKKGKSDGFNGTINAGTGYGRYEKANGGVNLNYRKGSYNWFGNYNYNYGRRYSETFLDRKLEYGNEQIIFDQNNFRPFTSHNQSFKAGVDYALNDKNTFGISATGFVNSWDLSLNNNTYQYRVSDDYLIEELLTRGTVENGMSNYSFNANYLRTFGKPGHELTADLEYTLFDGEKTDNITNSSIYANPENNVQEVITSLTPSDIDIIVGKLDYTLPLEKGKVELGAKTSYVTTDNDVQFFNVLGEVKVVDPARTNHYLYKERINAAYANWSRPFGKLNAQLGLRAEHTWYEGNSLTKQEVRTRDYLEFFPSAFLQYNISEKHQAGLSYSRRIDRPSYQMLNPFVYLLDKYTYFQGNPDLQPQFTNQLQANYTFMKLYSMNVGYSHTSEVYTQVPELNEEDERYSYSTMKNLADLYNMSVNISAPFDFTKWWSAQNSFSLFHNRYKGPLMGEQLDVNMLSYNLNIMNRFKLPNDFAAELTGFYNSPQVYGAMRSREMWAVNAGVQYTFMNKAATLKLNVNDIFGTMRWQGKQNFGGIDMTIRNQWESRQARLTFTYNFGNKDVKPIRRRKSAGEEEQRRLDGGNQN